MSKGLNGAAVALLMLVGLVAGGAAGYFFPTDSSLDTTTEGRIDYACAIAKDLESTDFSQLDLVSDKQQFDKAVTISALLGGGFVTTPDDATRAQELAIEVRRAVQTMSLAAMNEAISDVNDYCATL